MCDKYPNGLIDPYNINKFLALKNEGVLIIELWKLISLGIIIKWNIIYLFNIIFSLLYYFTNKDIINDY